MSSLALRQRAGVRDRSVDRPARTAELRLRPHSERPHILSRGDEVGQSRPNCFGASQDRATLTVDIKRWSGLFRPLQS